MSRLRSVLPTFIVARAGSNMGPRGLVSALAGGVGLVAAVIGCAVVAAVALVALGTPPSGRAGDGPAPQVVPPRPTELLVALSPGDPALQAGIVRGADVVYARGFEVELARQLARRLRIPKVRFVNGRSSGRLLASGPRRWQVAIAALRPTGALPASADPSVAYLPTDQAVLLRRHQAKPRSLAELWKLALCAQRGTGGASTLGARILPERKPALVSSRARLLQLVQTGACDAALVDGILAGRMVAGRGALLGPIAVRVTSGDGLVVAVSRDAGFGVGEIDRAIVRMRSDGTLHRLAFAWLGIDPSRLALLR